MFFFGLPCSFLDFLVLFWTSLFFFGLPCFFFWFVCFLCLFVSFFVSLLGCLLICYCFFVGLGSVCLSLSFGFVFCWAWLFQNSHCWLISENAGTFRSGLSDIFFRERAILTGVYQGAFGFSMCTIRVNHQGLGLKSGSLWASKMTRGDTRRG